MKIITKIKLLFSSTLLLLPIIVFAQIDNKNLDSVNIDIFKEDSLRKFIGLPLQEFINSDLLPKYKKHRFLHEFPIILQGVSFLYSEEISIDIYLYFENLKPYNEKRDWEFNKLKKEKIQSIRVVENYVPKKIIVSQVFSENLKKVGDQLNVPYPKGSVLNLYKLSPKHPVHPDKYTSHTRELLAFLIKNPKFHIEIGIHTGHIGKNSSNLKITQEYAKNLSEMFSNFKISQERVEIKAYGNQKPLTKKDINDRYKVTYTLTKIK